ncbi:hypothetical protein NicSoilB4_24810 [Arthrobacter sp. NicSoilB4]|uniref:DUF2304 domain-containing protein n=1 Tax=Arthrobacter sp. NicSoilB4 TaxID=2830997 RepID=UPI001CC4A52B|nr:DUF2304 domain-containing protein [Arthrobacter sp. NicSoilB4]BCW67718.1 hypothetical protein NicSoilB4_24810 [Arthrobacter sp. NicSoilB4]
MGNTLAPFIFALVMVAIVLELVRRKVFREKYAALWLVIGASALVLAGWPDLLAGVSKLLGIQVASNLLFALCIVLLLGVCLHLSWELSVVEDENRTLAEEVAILRTAVEQLESDFRRIPQPTPQAAKPQLQSAPGPCED